MGGAYLSLVLARLFAVLSTSKQGDIQMVLKVPVKYKEDIAPAPEDKIKRELSISEWFQAMADAGFDGEFLVNGYDGRQYKGEIKKQGDKFVVKSRRIPTAEETKAKLEALKKS
jgi:hypothetical protein